VKDQYVKEKKRRWRKEVEKSGAKGLVNQWLDDTRY